MHLSFSIDAQLNTSSLVLDVDFTTFVMEDASTVLQSAGWTNATLAAAERLLADYCVANEQEGRCHTLIQNVMCATLTLINSL